MKPPAQPHGGFSLWIPLLFTAILTMMVAGVNALMGKMQQAAVSATRTQIDGAYQAVTGFAAANRRLPSDIEFAALIKDLRDVHGQPLVYLYDNTFINAAPDMCSRSTAVITVNHCAADANCAAPAATANVAFAILGGGTVRSGDTAVAGYPVSQSFTSGTAGLAAASIIRTYSAGFAVGDYTTPAVNPYAYDDEMRFADVATLRQKAGCQGSQVRIVNNELPRGTVGQAYNATIFADGGVGVPPYIWCMDTTSAALTGNLPPGIVSNPPGAPVRNPLGANTSCMGVNPLARGSWFSGNALVLTGMPTTAGTYAVIYHVRDNNSVTPPATSDNSASKRLTIIIADAANWPFEYPTQWNGVPPLNASEVAVGGSSDTTGTSGNDDVIINGNLGSWINLGSGNDELLVTGDFTGGGNFGAGNDTVKIGGNATATIDLGSGDDYLDIGGNSTAYIDSGSGNDKVLIGGNASASISTGAGDDELHIKGSASGSIDTGSGNDKVRIDQDMSAYIDLGNDDDYLVIFGNTVGMQAGSGNDIVLIGGNAAGWLDLGPGNDYLEMLGNSAGFDADSGDDIVKITGAATNTINLGSGNDYLRVGGTITWIDGGAGTDRIYLMAYNVTNCASLLASRISANVEHVKVTDGMCRGSDFALP